MPSPPDEYYEENKNKKGRIVPSYKNNNCIVFKWREYKIKKNYKTPFKPKMTEEYKKALKILPNKNYETFTLDDIEKLSNIIDDGKYALSCYCCQSDLYRYWCNKLNVRYRILPKCPGCHCCC